MKSLLLKNCSILAGEGAAGFRHVKDGYLGIRGDTIAYIGTDKPEGFENEKDMGGALLCPGLINGHTHAAMTLLRGLGCGLPLDRWLHEAIFPVEARMTREDYRAGSALAQMEMLATGAIAYSDMYDMPIETVKLCETSGMKANLCRPLLSFDPNERAKDSWRLQESLEFFDGCHMAQNGRIRVDFSIHAEYTCYGEIAREYAALGVERGARMHLHLSETKKEHRDCKEKYGKTPAKWFNDLGVFCMPTAAAHCVAIEEEDMAILSECGVSVVHNPSSNMKLGSGFAPIVQLLERGINVGLGTDGAASNDNLNMVEEIHLAALIHNGILEAPTAMRPEQALNMATRNGARLQGRDDTGVLEVGKKADIAAFSTDAPHLIPSFDPVSTLVYSAQGGDVRMTMVDGEILYENGEYKTIDAERVRYDVQAALKRLYNR